MRHGRARRPRPMTHATGVAAASAGTRFCASPSAVQAPPHLAVGASAQDRDERPDLTGRWTGLFPACLGDGARGWRLGRRRSQAPRRRGRRDRHPGPQRHEGLLGQARGHRRGDPGRLFRTGDLAKVDDDGYFNIVGRQKDLIIRGGYNVYPREIEEVLHEHQAVAEVAVIGIPHAELGEEVGAAVQLKPGTMVTPAELRAFARERVAAYKYRAMSGSSANCPRAPPARSSTAKCSRRKTSSRDREPSGRHQRPAAIGFRPACAGEVGAGLHSASHYVTVVRCRRALGADRWRRAGGRHMVPSPADARWMTASGPSARRSTLWRDRRLSRAFPMGCPE